MKLFILIGLIIITTVGIPISASAHTHDELHAAEVEVLGELEDVGSIVQALGYDAHHEPWIIALNEGDVEHSVIFLEEGDECVFTAACDSDCEDLHLILLDDNGTIIAEEFEQGYFAEIEAYAPYTGSYSLVVDMEECDREPCIAASQTYERID